MSSAGEDPLVHLSPSERPIAGRDPETPLASSTGLPSRLAAVLAYGGWWVSGLLFWWIERGDAYVRFHAAQSVVVFGLIAVLIVLFGALGVLSLSVMPSAFAAFMWAAGLTWVIGLGLCFAAIWHAARGRRWSMPVAGKLADRLSRS
jgi:uncharacterized membrane protein